jgi:hypothetical protein
MALLVFAVCALNRRQEADAKPLPPASQRRAPELAYPEVAPELPAPRTAAAIPNPAVLTARAVQAPEGAAFPGKAPATDEMLNVLQSRLDLSEAQRDEAERALRDRTRDLDACQRQYRASGIFVPQEYGRKLIELKEAWYRSIDGFLDSEQHARFEVLVREGFFQPGTEFRADLSLITVVR